MYPAFPTYMNIPADPKIKEIAEQRIAVVRKMTDALFDYLTFDYRLAIDSYNMPVAKHSMYSTDTLVTATNQRNQTQKQIDDIREALDDDSVPEMQARLVEASILAPLLNQLASQDQWISEIQKELEKTE